MPNATDEKRLLPEHFRAGDVHTEPDGSKWAYAEVFRQRYRETFGEEAPTPALFADRPPNVIEPAGTVKVG